MRLFRRTSWLLLGSLGIFGCGSSAESTDRSDANDLDSADINRPNDGTTDDVSDVVETTSGDSFSGPDSGSDTNLDDAVVSPDVLIDSTPPPSGSTAHDGILPYSGMFAYGSNTGYFGWDDNDTQLGNILFGGAGQPGVGVKSLRGAFFDDFITQYGLDIRKKQFAGYQAQGGRDMVVFLNASYHIGAGCKVGGTFTYDSAKSTFRCKKADGTFDDTLIISRRDGKKYGACTSQSWMHANMYKPIWITDATGAKKPNPENYLADYVYGLVSTYKTYGIKFYEVWNEPDFTFDYEASQVTTSAKYWGKVNPDPCSMPNTNAPISHHVRLHRVIYEAVKAADPTAYVATGGIGYTSYLDALLRNTDNPGAFVQNDGEGDAAEGSVSARYPLGGGAYFDTLSFHSYPQYALSRYVGTGTCPTGERKDGDRCMFEHSDAAVDAYLTLKDSFLATLKARGYGDKFPQKHVIVTESNVPRVPARYKEGTKLADKISQWGSEPYARNYIIKALVMSQKNAIRQFHIYAPSDEVREDGTDCAGVLVGTDNTKVQGLFKNLSCIKPYSQVRTMQAIAYKSTSDFLFGYTFDPTLTAKLALPKTVEGAAFRDDKGKVRYALWARSNVDRDESSKATYAFPSAVSAPATLTARAWDWSETKATSTTSSSAVSLTAAPSFFE